MEVVNSFDGISPEDIVRKINEALAKCFKAASECEPSEDHVLFDGTVYAIPSEKEEFHKAIQKRIANKQHPTNGTHHPHKPR